MRLSGPVAVDMLVLDGEITDPDGGSLTPLLTRLHPGLPVVLHVYPGADAGEDSLIRVEKGGDFERLKETARRVLGAGQGAA